VGTPLESSAASSAARCVADLLNRVKGRVSRLARRDW
jgi:hypothetical protein